MLRKLIILGLTIVGGIFMLKANNPSSLLSSVGQNQAKVKQISSSRENPLSQHETRLTGKRLLALTLFILLVPVITAPLANRILDKQSNTANLLLLFGYTGLDIVAAYMVGVISVGSIWSSIGCLIALLAVFSYNLWICAFLARLRK
jgi:hypothetical protein